MRLRNLSTPAAPAAVTSAVSRDTRVLIAAAPAIDVKEDFEPFACEVETFKEARNIAIALRNHVRYMGHASTSPAVLGLMAKLHSIEGIDMNVYEDDGLTS